MYGIEDKVAAIMYSLLILMIALGIRLAVGTFLIPAGIFALAWFIFTFFPLVVLLEAPINSLAILYILAAVSTFALGATPFSWRVAFRENRSKSLSAANFDSHFLKFSLYFSALAAALFSIIAMQINGFNLQQVIFDPMRTSAQFAAMRGKGEMEYGITGILSVMFTYLCPVLGGLRIFAPRRNWFFMVSIAPSLLTMISQSSKLVFLVSLCFYLSGAIIAKIYANRMGILRIQNIPKIMLYSTVLSSLVLISFLSRIGQFNFYNLGSLIDPLMFSVASYTLGEIYAFADFFSFTIDYPSVSNFDDEYYSYGAYTFASIFNVIGIGKEFPPGMYYETGWYGNVFETNIFTVFRGLIYDFGIVGSLFFMFVFGVFAHAVASRALNKTRAWFTLVVLISLLVFIFMGYLFSVFVARYVFLTAVVTWTLLVLNESIYPMGKTQPNIQHD